MNRTMIAAGLSALLLAGCQQSGPRGNHAICYNFRSGAAATPASSAAATTSGATTQAATVTPIDDCLRRWAYTLAPTRDPASMAAEAAVAACTEALARWNEQALTQGTTAVQAPSITTGQETNPMAEHNQLAHARALLYVVEARAGRCAPPPVVNGVPQG